ncbi:SPOR domain-containing protein [Oceanimonas doudoroffii]|uniref:SPOR domain-containing protein n=1 Tax=Oceanimonas doudoroffii TaxID=84158 RepID=A0A233RJB7_9GAMM|nr:SPOR domain-containing protein [Oceanimonas doudoroffii]OXY83485.1 hypothetical protein B6S08_08370 [Oceanimonas doudoroffii]
MAAEMVLTLSSQQQLLERLLHLSRLEQGLVLLSGPPGAGKRTLAGLLVQQAGLPAAATLDARLLTSQAAFRDALLSDWFSDAIFDPDDHLLESVTRLLPAAPGRRLLVVENGQWLTDPQLQELAELCLGLPEAQRPFVLLLGSPAWAGGVRSLLRNQPDLPVLELEVPELSEEDKRQLCTHLGVTASDQPATLRYPGDLVATSEPSMRTPTYRQWLEQKPVKILLTGLILLGLLLLVSLLLDREPPQPEVAQPFQAESLPEAPAQPLTLTPEGSGAPLSAAEPSAERLAGEWPAQPLPEEPRVTTQVVESPDDSSKERVVIEDEVVSQLLQRKSGEALAAARVPADATPAAQPVPAATPASSLFQKPAGHYTLQLMASKDRQALQQLASRHTLQPAWVYARQLNDQPWFVLIFGDFASAELARRAIERLPAELRAAKPWPKPFGQVQKEASP